MRVHFLCFKDISFENYCLIYPRYPDEEKIGHSYHRSMCSLMPDIIDLTTETLIGIVHFWEYSKKNLCEVYT